MRAPGWGIVAQAMRLGLAGQTEASGEVGRRRQTKASEGSQAARRVGGMLSTVKAALVEWLDSDDGREARAAWEASQAHLAVVEQLARRLRRHDDPAAVALLAAELHEAAHVVGDRTAALVLLDVVHEALAAACPPPGSVQTKASERSSCARPSLLPGQPTSAGSTETDAGEGRRGRPAATQSDCGSSDGLHDGRFSARAHRAVSGPLATGAPVGSATLDTGGDTLAGLVDVAKGRAS